jgi:hypothetical protein
MSRENGRGETLSSRLDEGVAKATLNVEGI